MSLVQFVQREFFQKTKLNKIRRICLTLEGNVITTEYGFVDSDKIQKTTQTCDGLYNPGHGAYQSPEVHAANMFNRWCRQYQQTGNKDTLEEAENSDSAIDLILFPLSREFRAPKAISKKPCVDKDDPEKCHIPNRKLQNLIDNCRILANKKYNGLRLFIVKSSGQWHVYTIAVKLADEQYPWLKEWFENYADPFVPEDSIIDVEAVANDAISVEEYETIKSMKPNTSGPKAKEILDRWLKKDHKNTVGAVLHNLILWGGVNMLKSPYIERLEALRSLEAQAVGATRLTAKQAIEQDQDREVLRSCGRTMSDVSIDRIHVRTPWMSENFYEATQLMTEEKWEGLVLYDKFGVSQYSMNAQFYRPDGCWKWKPLDTDDFVIVGVNMGDGKNYGKASSFKIAQYDKKGNLVDCGSVYSGITQEMIDSDLANYIGKVVELEFPSRYGTNTKKGLPTVMHGRIKHFREDKAPEDCVYDPSEEKE